MKSNKKNKVFHTVLKVIALALVVLLVFSLARLASESDTIKSIVARSGVIGIFSVSVLSGFNFAVPIPAIAFLPLFLEAGLNFWTIIVVIALGVSLADTIAYLVGKVSRQALSHSPWEKRVYTWLEHFHRRHSWSPMLILFLFASLVPLPNEIILVPMGFLGYRFGRIFPILFAGNLVFNLLYSTGVLNLFRAF